MSYSVEFSTAARRQLRRLHQEIQSRLVREIEKLADNPRPVGYKMLKGEAPRYRIRVGDYRVVYRIYDDVVVVLVVAVGHRREVYRNL
jgi:mRNA interferase RelE/StbE